MRIVLKNHSEVCHVWAHQSQSEGRAGQVFFEGPTIYSYGRHFSMARIVTKVMDVPLVLMTTRTYSASTAKHMSMVRHATSHMVCFMVRDIDANTKAEHEVNWKDLMDRCYEHVERAHNAREGIDGHLRCASALEDEADRYATAFGLKHPPSHYVESMSVKLAPKIARAAQLRAVREEQNRRYYEQRRIEEAKTYQEHMVDWRAGMYHGRMSLKDGTDCIRVKGDEVETGNGARVHLRMALILLEAWRKRRCGEAIPLPVQIGPYEGIALSEDMNTLSVGCHRFNWDEANSVLGNIK